MITHLQELKGAAIAAALSCHAGAAQAADAQGSYAIEGPGAQSCTTFMAHDRGSTEYAVSLGFIAGYLGAANAFRADTFDLTPWQTIELSAAQLLQFCEANPDAALAQGLEQYASFLHPQRITESEQKLSLQVGDKVVVQYGTTVERIRDALRERGFGTDEEPLSGLKEYQESIGVEPTGLPDQATLSRLIGRPD